MNSFHLLKRWHLLRNDAKGFFLLALTDVLYPFAKMLPTVRLIRNRLKNRLQSTSRFVLRFGEHAYACRPGDIGTLLEVHIAKTYHKHPDFTPRPGNVVVDVGANIGEYAIPAAKAAGNKGTVIALEPNPQAFSLLEQNLLLNKQKNIQAIKKAVYSRKGKIKMYTHPGSNVFDSVNPIFASYYPTEAVTLDAIAGTLKKIDLVKMDIEGGEFLALKGAHRVLQRKPRLIIELHGQANRNNVERLLRKYQYCLVHELQRSKECWIAYWESSG